MRTVLLMVVAASMAAGCVSENGKDVDQSKVTAFQKGVTTRQDAINALGPPSSSGVQAETGLTWLAWSHSKVSMSGASFVPIVGPLLGGTTSQYQSCLLYFDGSDHYTSGSCQQGQTGGGAHLGS